MNPLALTYIVLFVILLPWLALRSMRALRQGHALPSKASILVRTTMMLVVFAAFSLFVARYFEIPLFPPLEWNARAAAACAAVLLLMLATIPLRWRATPDETKRRMMLTRPQSGGDLGLWLVVSAAAGVSEEITYRGVLFQILWYTTGSPWAAAGISAVAFAVAHAVQGWRSALVILCFALAAHGVVWLAGSLYFAMLLHFVYDALAGCIYLRLGRAIPPADPIPAVSTNRP